MSKEKVYVSFKEIENQEEKLRIILDKIYSVTSKEYIAKLVETGEFDIVTSRKYKDSCGCPVIYLGKKIEGKKDSRVCYREINKKFPLIKLTKDLIQKHIKESY